jgi:hypothetical protein
VRLIPTQVHAGLDVAVGVLLVALPWIAGFPDARTLTGVCVGVGAAVLVIGFLTDYETALARLVPMRLHLALDLVVSFFVIGTAVGVAIGDGGGRMWAPLLAIGIAVLPVIALTDPVPPAPERRRLRPASTSA